MTRPEHPEVTRLIPQLDLSDPDGRAQAVSDLAGLGETAVSALCGAAPGRSGASATEELR